MPETVSGERPATPDLEVVELRARAELAEQRLSDLRAMYEDMVEQRNKWETVAQRLALPAPKPEATPETPPLAPPPSRWRQRLLGFVALAAALALASDRLIG
jgi:hypothetical protein